MKRIFLGLLLLTVVGALACGPQANDNTVPNANVNPSPNPSPSPRSTPTLGNDLSAYEEVLVTITIGDNEEKNPIIVSVVPETADLSGGKRVQWLVDNQSTVAAGQDATVVIGPFTGKANPSDNKPFGPDACANMFKLDFLKEGKQSREISEQEKFQQGEDGYTYEITLRAADGSVLNRFTKKLPDIIISGMGLKPGASPSASPSPKRKTY